MQEITSTELNVDGDNSDKEIDPNVVHSQGKDEEKAVSLPSIPGKHYFTIGEMSRLCQIKPHVLRYWEHEFSQLKNVKRRGNRRYYTRQQVLVVRQIRDLLHEQGYTILGAKARMAGEHESKDFSQSKQLVRQIKSELEDVLGVLKESVKV